MLCNLVLLVSSFELDYKNRKVDIGQCKCKCSSVHRPSVHLSISLPRALFPHLIDCLELIRANKSTLLTSAYITESSRTKNRSLILLFLKPLLTFSGSLCWPPLAVTTLPGSGVTVRGAGAGTGRLLRLFIISSTLSVLSSRISLHILKQNWF